MADFKAAWDKKIDDYEKGIQAHAHLTNREIGPMEMDSTLKSLIFAKRNGEDFMNNAILCKKIAREIRDDIIAKDLVEEYITEQHFDDILKCIETKPQLNL